MDSDTYFRGNCFKLLFGTPAMSYSCAAIAWQGDGSAARPSPLRPDQALQHTVHEGANESSFDLPAGIPLLLLLSGRSLDATF